MTVTYGAGPAQRLLTDLIARIDWQIASNAICNDAKLRGGTSAESSNFHDVIVTIKFTAEELKSQMQLQKKHWDG